MDSIYIYGGNFLRGETKIQGSKNAVLPILAASLLVKGTCVIKNCPRIADVYLMQNLLQELGGFVSWAGSTVTVNAFHVNDRRISGESVTRMFSRKMLPPAARAAVRYVPATIRSAGTLYLASCSFSTPLILRQSLPIPSISRLWRPCP